MIVVPTTTSDGIPNWPGVGFVVIVGGETYPFQSDPITPIEVIHETINDDPVIVAEFIV